MKIRYYIVSLFALLSITSCSDFLDLTPISEASSANYYKNTSDINSALTACSGSGSGNDTGAAGGGNGKKIGVSHSLFR